MYTATKLEDQDYGWFIENDETGEKYVVFCNPNDNTAEAAVAVITPNGNGEVQE